MSDYSPQYEGINWTDKYLTVSFVTGSGPVKRFRHVKVPIHDLVQAGVAEAINRHIAKELQAYWETGQPPLRGL